MLAFHLCISTFYFRKSLDLQTPFQYCIACKSTQKAEGSAEITVSNSAGECGTVTLTVSSATPAYPEDSANEDSSSLKDNMEIRQEMIRLINQTRKDNGVSELPVNEALMNAAQACSDRRCTWYHAPDEGQAAAAAGYPYGFGSNLTVFTGTANAAQRAVNNWINSPGHFETMIDPRCDCIGVGVTQHDGVTYCYMFAWIPNSVNFYTQMNNIRRGSSRKLDDPLSWRQTECRQENMIPGSPDFLLRFCIA